MYMIHKKITSLIIVLLVIGLPLLLFNSGSPQNIRQKAAGMSCNNTGVTKNSDGTYSFAWLHVDTSGSVVDQNNCIVQILGINTGNTYWGNAEHPDLTAMTFYKSHIIFNAIRLNYQAYWWNMNVSVPDRSIGYQTWIKQIITWAKSLGLYVILDTGPEYHALPCGHGNPNCPPQNAGSLTNDPTQQIDYEPTSIQSLTQLSQLYGSDPAIIWDVWNEPANRPADIPTLIADYNERMNTVKQNAPKALFQVYSRAIEGGANFTQGNIMEDFHDYSGVDLTTKIQAAKAKGIATIVGEYGGAAGPGGFMNALVTYAKRYNTNLTYYEDRNLFDSRVRPTAVTANGQQMNTAYISIFGTPENISPSLTTSPTPTNTVSQTPTSNPNTTVFSLTLCPHGVGNCGDNVASTGGNINPLHTTRTIALSMMDTSNHLIGGSPFAGQVNYTAATENFQGTVSIPPVPNGQYLVSVKMEGYLTKQLPGIVTVTRGQPVTLAPVPLVTGDINNDNQVDLLDYNMLVGCYGVKITTQSCLAAPTALFSGADILDDGPGSADSNKTDPPVDGGDYNEFLRELSVQVGQ